MEWDYVLQELEALPAEYKEIRFQPLKHVVEVFSSADPPGLTNEVSCTRLHRAFFKFVLKRRLHKELCTCTAHQRPWSKLHGDWP